MAKYQILELEEFLKNDDEFMSPDEFMELRKPKIQETIEMPEEHIFQCAKVDITQKFAEGEITRMLRIAPGILPPTDNFPKSYKPPKPAKLPAFIPVDRHNRIPILLDEKYFRFSSDDDDDDDTESVKQSVRDAVNNLNGSSNGNHKRHGRSKRLNVATNSSSGIKDGSNPSHYDNEDLEKRFSTVGLSDDDNCNVQSNPVSSFYQMPQTTQESAECEYYNAHQLYEMKRGKKY